jgi:hypothetical protein
MMLADYKLFLDDERMPGKSLEDAVIVRSYCEFKQVITERGIPKYITFDHDLGDGEYTGKKCAEYLAMRMMGRMRPDNIEDFRYDVHSQNPVGAKNIRCYLDQFLEEMRNEQRLA